TPQIIEQVTSTTYKKVTFCFNATQSGVHYLTFGSFKQNSISTNQSVLFYLDDISVDLVSSMPTAVISPIAANFCGSSPIILNGASSSGETEYEWDIYDITSGSEVLKYNGAFQTGTAGTADVSALLGVNKIPGHCYRAYLTVYNGCEVSTSVDFCIVNPDISFITDGNPVCESVPITLQVTGDNGWTYAWSDNSGSLGTGVGTTSLLVNPTIGNATYTVVVTTPENCTHTETLTLTVNSLTGQVAPTMNGVNGTNEYTVYVQSGGTVSFNSLISNNSGELVEANLTSESIPTPFNLSLPPNTSNGGNMSFSWQTPLNYSGIYDFTVYVKDNNGCQVMDNTYTFHIKVICDYCPVCISYDDRTPSNNPLPPETKAGKCIEVGLNATVQIGSGNSVYLQAGETIEMGDFFDSNSGVYEAVIEPTTCVTGCQDCCTGFNGFTYDSPLPNIFSPNGDGINDVWFIHDNNHPWCAFGATGFELYIVNSWQSNIYSQVVYEGLQCCPFTSLSPSPSSINWDGRINVGTGKGQFVTEGVYFYVIYLHGCGQTITLSGNISVYINPALVQSHEADKERVESLNNNLALTDETNSQLQTDDLPEDHFFVFPNPTESFIRVHAGKKIKEIMILDANGKQLIRKVVDLEQPVDLSGLSSGNYQVRVTFEDQSVREKTIVKN
ncbi:gliding motility-associated C-terminal domain-containing protein, partial [uncultured Fluviicola sp.]|uniref:T9SS type B sorting domain-containing protein n=1 Tax=uncultured Fluviicola sp. TaxID=463303 RepID=UPI0025D72C5F